MKSCPVTNFIRWRYMPESAPAQDEQKNPLDSEASLLEKDCVERTKPSLQMESNARFVEWEDGTKSLVIGNKHYEVQTEPVNSTLCFANYKKLDLLKGQVT